LPALYGVFYRQVSRVIYPGVIVVYNLCGVPTVVAESSLTDYTWAVALSQGRECPPFPKATLPEAQCVVAPCASSGP
jgi:hypothetical protein